MRLNILDKVFGQWSKRAGQKRASDGRTRGFHPARRTPGRADDFKVRVESAGLAKDGDDISAVVVDGEGFQFGIGLSRRKIVVGITLQGKITGAHGLAQNAEADSLFRIEEHFEKLCAPRFAEFLRDQPCRRIGERRAEAVDLLVCDGIIDIDGESRDTRGTELQWRLFQERLAQVFGGFVYLDSGDLMRQGFLLRPR